MPFYLTRFSYTPETWARLIKTPEDRRAAGVDSVRRLDHRVSAHVLSIRVSLVLASSRETHGGLDDGLDLRLREEGAEESTRLDNEGGSLDGLGLTDQRRGRDDS